MTANAAAPPEAALSVLPRVDGSARYSCARYTVTGSVNGPMEAQRRDEHISEAHIDVIVRPAAGVGGTRERHLESLLQSSLSHLVLARTFPRCLIQIVLQVESTPENAYTNTKLAQATLNLSILPALFNTAVLALISGAIPLRSTASACTVAFVPHDAGKRRAVVNPAPRDVEQALSVHALAFVSRGELLLAESEGDFTMTDWDEAFDAASKVCAQPETTRTGSEMALDEDTGDAHGPDMRQFVRSTVESKVAADLHWT